MNSRRIFTALSLLFLSACAASHYYDARYVEAPVETEVRADNVTGSQVRALASVIGVARADHDSGRQKQVEIRLRFENLGKIPALFLPDKLSLVSADLIPFGPANVAQVTDLTIPAGETRQFDVAFPAPPVEPDWSGLNLRFTLQFQDSPVTVGVPFHRIQYPDYYYPYPTWRGGVGYGYCW